MVDESPSQFPTRLGSVRFVLHANMQGDPIESNALRKSVVPDAYDQLPESYFCTINAIKAHTGHLEGSAGNYLKCAHCSDQTLLLQQPDIAGA